MVMVNCPPAANNPAIRRVPSCFMVMGAKSKISHGREKHAGKHGEIEYDHRSFDPVGSQHPDHGIGDAGSQSSADSDQRRDKSRVLESRFYHKEAADERQHYAGRLYGRWIFSFRIRKEKIIAKKGDSLFRIEASATRRWSMA